MHIAEGIGLHYKPCTCPKITEDQIPTSGKGPQGFTNNIEVGDWIHFVKDGNRMATVCVKFIIDGRMIVKYKNKYYHCCSKSCIRLQPGEYRLFV